MTTIKRKISRPYLAIIVAIPITMILLFNLLVSYYSQRQAEEDLSAAVASASESLADGDLASMVSILKNQDHASSAEVIVYNGMGQLSNIFNQYSTFVDDELAALAYEQISNLPEGEIGSFFHQGDTYYVVAVAYMNEDALTPQMVFPTSTTENKPQIGADTSTEQETPSTPAIENKPSIGDGSTVFERRNQTTEESTEETQSTDSTRVLPRNNQTTEDAVVETPSTDGTRVLPRNNQTTEDTVVETPSTDGTRVLPRNNQTTEDTPTITQVASTVSPVAPAMGAVSPTGNVLVYISKGLVIDEFVAATNLFLGIIAVVVILIATFISMKISKSIAKPIERLTAMVENMKADEIVAIVEENDCVELQKLSTEINALSRRLYHFDQSQKKFLHNASHELRTPLMSIQGYADGIEMGVFEDAKGTAHLISDQSKRLTRLVDGLLTLARTENFNANKQLEKISLSNGLLDLLSGYTGYAMSQNIEIHHHIAPDIMVMGNQELLTSSVGNIISNGIRYATSTVSLSLKTEGKQAIITVRDDGKGIENIDHIFERFSKGEKGNFGLGLSIAKTSIEMMNGQIKAYNDQGAVFEMTLDLL